MASTKTGLFRRRITTFQFGQHIRLASFIPCDGSAHPFPKLRRRKSQLTAGFFAADAPVVKHIRAQPHRVKRLLMSNMPDGGQKTGEINADNARYIQPEPANMRFLADNIEGGAM